MRDSLHPSILLHRVLATLRIALSHVERRFNWCCRRLVRGLVLLRRIGDACVCGIHVVCVGMLNLVW